MANAIKSVRGIYSNKASTAKKTQISLAVALLALGITAPVQAADPLVVDGTTVSYTDGAWENGYIPSTVTPAGGAIVIKNAGQLTLNGMNNTATIRQFMGDSDPGVRITGTGSSLIVNGKLSIQTTNTATSATSPYGLWVTGANDVRINGQISIIDTYANFNGGYGVNASSGAQIDLGSNSVIVMPTSVSGNRSIGMMISDGTVYTGRRTQIYAQDIDITAGGGAYVSGNNSSTPLIQLTGTHNKVTINTNQTSASSYAYGLYASSGGTLNVGDQASNSKGSIDISSSTNYVVGMGTGYKGTINLYGDNQKIVLNGLASRGIYANSTQGNINVTGDNYHFETTGDNATTVRLEGGADSGSLTITNQNAGNNIIAATGSNSYAVYAIGVANASSSSDANKLSITQKGGKIYSEQSVAFASTGKRLELNLDNVESYGGTYLIKADDILQTPGDYAHANVVLNAQNNTTLRGDVLVEGKYESYVLGGGRQAAEVNINLDSSSALTGNVLAKSSGIATVTLNNSTMTGDISAEGGDSATRGLSTSSMNVKGSSRWTGNALANAASGITGDVNVETNDTATWEGYARNVKNVRVLGSSTWKMTDNSNVNALTHQGTIAFTAPTAGSFKTLTVNGDYIGSGGTFALNAALGDDNAPSDKVVITGNSSGNAYITVANAGGLGAQTVQGMKLVSVGGTSGATFSLAAPAAVGVYQYNTMAKGTDGGWYLTYTDNPTPPTPPTPDPDPTDNTGGGGHNGGGNNGGAAVDPNLVRPAITAYLANITAAGNMFMPALQERFYAQELNKNSRGAWAYVNGKHQEYYGNEKVTEVKTNRTVIQVGTDVLSMDVGGTNVGLGVMAGYGHDNTGLRSDSDAIAFGGSKATATTEMDGYNLGLYGSLIKTDKYYLDTWAQYSWFNNKVHASYYPEAKYDSTAFGAAVEGGYAFEVASKLFIEPKLRLGYMTVDSDDYDDNGTQVHNADYGNFFSKLGVRLRSTQFAINPYVELNWQMNSSRASASFNDMVLNDDTPKNVYEIKAGVAGYVAKSVQMWGSIGGQFGKSKYQSVEGTVGVQYLW